MAYKRCDQAFKAKLAARADELKAFPKTPQKILTVTIDETGDLVYLKGDSADVLLELGEVVQRRASHVEPASRDQRVFFHLLRFFFGEKGRIADWTRNWGCLWRVNTSPVGGPILTWAHVWKMEPSYGSMDYTACFAKRQDAIDAEIAFLNDFFLERGA